MKVSPVIRPGKVARRSLAIGSDATHEDSGTTDVTSEAAATTQAPTAPRTIGEGIRIAVTLTTLSDCSMNNALRLCLGPKNPRSGPSALRTQAASTGHRPVPAADGFYARLVRNRGTSAGSGSVLRLCLYLLALIGCFGSAVGALPLLVAGYGEQREADNEYVVDYRRPDNHCGESQLTIDLDTGRPL